MTVIITPKSGNESKDRSIKSKTIKGGSKNTEINNKLSVGNENWRRVGRRKEILMKKHRALVPMVWIHNIIIKNKDSRKSEEK